MKLVVLESPYAGNIEENIKYAKACLRDCLEKDEAPIASHLLFPGALDDLKPQERSLGMAAGHAWISVCDYVVVYCDRGISAGMEAGIERARLEGKRVELRFLYSA